MTIEERFEERRRDREENRQLWRGTQRQIDALTQKIADTNDSIRLLRDEMAEMGRKTDARFHQLREETVELDRKTDARIQALVSAIAESSRRQ